jgi:hypothetical protein
MKHWVTVAVVVIDVLIVIAGAVWVYSVLLHLAVRR